MVNIEFLPFWFCITHACCDILPPTTIEFYSLSTVHELILFFPSRTKRAEQAIYLMNAVSELIYFEDLVILFAPWFSALLCGILDEAGASMESFFSLFL